MKNIIFIVCSLILLSVSCRKDIDLVDTSYIFPGPKEYVKASIGGFIIDENDKSIQNASVTLGDKTILTDENGIFQFRNVIVDRNGAYIKVIKGGYFHGSRTLIVGPGTRNTTTIQLISNTISIGISSNSGGKVDFGDCSVEIPGMGFAKEDGTQFFGYVKIAAKLLDPTDPKFGYKMPGRLLGISEDDKVTGMISMGMLEVEMHASTGELLKIREGYEAIIRLKVPVSIIGKAPANISLWYFDESSGIWKEEGSANLINGFYEGKVKHFSLWNTDYKSPVIEMIFKVRDTDGNPISGAKVYTKLVNSWLYGTGYTDNMGNITGLIPKDELLDLSVFLPSAPCITAAFQQQIGPYSKNDSITIIVSPPGINKYTIKGDVVNCNDLAVTNGYIKIAGEKDVIWLDDKGHFENTYFICSPPANNYVFIVAYDFDAGNQSLGTQVNINLNGTVDAGILKACKSFDEYIQYSFGGDTYTDLPKFSNSGFSNLSISTTTIDLSVYITIPYPIDFGKYPVYDFYVYGKDKSGKNIHHKCSTMDCSELSATIIEYSNTPGSYISGVFSGMVLDSTNKPNPMVIPVTGKFRGKM